MTYGVPDMTQSDVYGLAAWISSTVPGILCEFNENSNRLSWRAGGVPLVVEPSTLLGVSTPLTVTSSGYVESDKPCVLNWTRDIVVHANFCNRSYASVPGGGVNRGDVLIELPINDQQDGLVYNGRQDDAHIIIDEEVNSLLAPQIYITDGDGNIITANLPWTLTLNVSTYQRGLHPLTPVGRREAVAALFLKLLYATTKTV